MLISKVAVFSLLLLQSSNKIISKMENEFKKRGAILNKYVELPSWYNFISVVNRLIASNGKGYQLNFILRSIVAKILETMKIVYVLAVCTVPICKCKKYCFCLITRNRKR